MAEIKAIREPGHIKSVTFPAVQRHIRLTESRLEGIDGVSVVITRSELPNAAIALRILNGEQEEVPEGWEVEREEAGPITEIRYGMYLFARLVDGAVNFPGRHWLSLKDAEQLVALLAEMLGMKVVEEAGQP